MDHFALAKWLLTEGGPAIRYRTATELLPCGPDERDRLAADLLAGPLTQLWLSRVGEPGGRFSTYHGSQPEAFENAASKLADLGLRAGMAPLDERMAPFRAWLAERALEIEDIVDVDYTQVKTRAETQSALDRGIRLFETMEVAGRLAWMGYTDPAVGACILRRLDALDILARTGNHALEIDQDTFGDYPNNPFRKSRFIDPQFYGHLPSIHDVYALAHLPPALLSAEARRKLATLIAYILHPDYQALQDGYGVMRAGPRRYFGIGWSIHLPGYGGSEMTPWQAQMLVQRLELMVRFPSALSHPWVQDTLAHLEGFRLADGAYRFPDGYLREAPSGYWVGGYAMRLEVNRRQRRSVDLESTFRMLLLRKLVGERSE